MPLTVGLGSGVGSGAEFGFLLLFIIKRMAERIDITVGKTVGMLLDLIARLPSTVLTFSPLTAVTIPVMGNRAAGSEEDLVTNLRLSVTATLVHVILL